MLLLWVIIAAVTVIVSILIVTHRSEGLPAATPRGQGDTAPVVFAARRRGMSAEELLGRVQLRGAYMFNPRLGLNMLEIGLQWASASSPPAEPTTAVRAAMPACSS